MLPDEIAPIYDDLVKQFGQQNGTVYFNFISEYAQRQIPFIQAVQRGIAAYLKSLDIQSLQKLTDQVFRSRVFKEHLLTKLEYSNCIPAVIHQFISYSLQYPDVLHLPNFPLKMVYERERINPHQLNILLCCELGQDTESVQMRELETVAAFFLNFLYISFSRMRKLDNIVSFLQLFDRRVLSSKEECAFFMVLCKLGLYFTKARGVPIRNVLAFLGNSLRSSQIDSKDMVFILYDFYHDDRYKAEHLLVLFSLVQTCISTFYPERKQMIPAVMNLQKDFIRISQSNKSRYTKKIFELYVQNPHLNLTDWVREGARIIRKHGDSARSAKAYFDRESDLSKRIWMEIDSGIYFKQVSARLQFFINAITEKQIVLKSTEILPSSESRYEYFTDGRAIFIPEYIDYLKSREDNYMVLLHCVTHECAHIEFDSFLLSLRRFEDTVRVLEKLFPSQYNRNRTKLEIHIQKVKQKLAEMGYDVRSVSLREDKMPFLTRLFFFVKFPFILRDIWNVVEDNRVNSLLYAKYTGFASERNRVDEIDFQQVLAITELKPFVNLVSGFVQYAWFGKIKGRIDDICIPYFKKIIQLFAATSSRRDRDTYSSLITAAKIHYFLLLFLEKEAPGLLNEFLWIDDIDLKSLNIQSHPRNAILQIELEWYKREIFNQQGKEDLEDASAMDSIIGNADRHIGKECKHNAGNFTISAEDFGDTYLYPEWDYERNCYLADRCTLIESSLPKWRNKNSDDLMTQNVGYVYSVRRAFMALKPKELNESHGIDDGHEIDFDRYVDCLMDLSTGHQMENNFYIFREKKVRSVVSALVFDMSPSTWEVTKLKSIFAHQKSAAYILAEAMSAIGDRFGVYSFFDFGPPATLFYTIKDFDEVYSMKCISCLEEFQAARDGWSRLAVGLRHLIQKLRHAEEKSKIIFFITDGLPIYFERSIDRGAKSKSFQSDGREVRVSSPVRVLSLIQKSTNYALHDLRKVYEEASIVGVRLFCITLDGDTVALVQKIFGTAFIYLPDISHLPQRLLEVFKKVSS